MLPLESSSPASYQTLTPYPALVDLSPSPSSTSTGHLHTLTPYPTLLEPLSQTGSVAAPTGSSSSSLPAIASSVGRTNTSLDSHISQIVGELTGSVSSHGENLLGNTLFTITATSNGPQILPSLSSHPSHIQLATPTSTQLQVSSVLNSLSSMVPSSASTSHLPPGSLGEERNKTREREGSPVCSDPSS